jgi:hypothetical protein
MGRGLTYNDALRVLGADSKLLKLLDKISVVTVLALGGVGLLEARSEIFRLSSDVVKRIDQRLQGLSRTDRTHHLEAAHAIIVVSAFFEEFQDIRFPIDVARLKITAKEQTTILSQKLPKGHRVADLVEVLLDTKIPTPDPSVPFSVLIRELNNYFSRGSAGVLDFVKGLAVWEEVKEYEKNAFSREISYLPQRAQRRYQEAYLRLSVDCPEFFVWARQNAEFATQNMINETKVDLQDQIAGLRAYFETNLPALAGLQKFFDSLEQETRSRHQLRSALSAEYRDFLDRSIVETGDLPVGVEVPTLGESYISPPFRVREVLSSEDDPSRESWWSSVPTREDFEAYMAGFLTSSSAANVPLLILGQPGSGKSVLVRVLSAVLSSTEFFPIRVVLRDMGTEMDLLQQIEAGASAAVNGRLEWQEVIAAAGNATPVVFLDGFDELLQATGVSHSDYLIRVQEFQHREALKGQSVIFVVTSRIAVANRAKFPARTIALRLDPFTTSNICKWLDIWNGVNGAYFISSKIKSLDSGIALANLELAQQPLLLLLLALYDLNGNPLSNREPNLGKVDLYEGLLQEFVKREVEKLLKGANEKQIKARVEREIVKLSVVAFAMFNRSAQWVSDVDLDRDMAALGVESGRWQEANMRAFLSPAELTVGRFFFIYEALATQDEKRVHTYEFLHATFSEFLVARLAYRMLQEIMKREQVTESTFATVPLDYGQINAILSYSPLTTRSSIVGFLREMVAGETTETREALSATLRRLVASSQLIRTDSTFASYAPRRATITSRIAAYTANLVLLLIIVDERLYIGDWWLSENEPREVWRRLATLWKAELREDEWTGLVKVIRVDRLLEKTQVSVTLAIREEEESSEGESDLGWLANYESEETGETTIIVAQPPSVAFNWIARDAAFTLDSGENVMAHTIKPLSDGIGSALTAFLMAEPGSANTAGNLLLAAWVSGMTSDPSVRLVAYQQCLSAALHVSKFEKEGERGFWTLFMKIIAQDPEMPLDFVKRAIQRGIDAGADGVALLAGALSLAAIHPSESLELTIVIANRIPDGDQIADLAAWLQLVEMKADGATMLRVKRYTNSVPFMNQHLNLTQIAKTNANLVRRARQAMNVMELADRVVWPKDF